MLLKWFFIRKGGRVLSTLSLISYCVMVVPKDLKLFRMVYNLAVID